MKTILISLMAIFLSIAPLFSNAENPPADCNAFKKIHADAMKNFTDHRGEEHITTGLFGESKSWEYKLGLWDATQVELFPDMFSSANTLEFIFCQSETLERANACHAELQKKIEACFPVEYYLSGKADEDGQAFVKISDKRDGDPDDLIFTFAHPNIVLQVVKDGAYYNVEMNFKAGEE